MSDAGGAEGGGSGGGSGGTMVPIERLHAMQAKLNDANARVGELETLNRTLEQRAEKAERAAKSSQQLADRVESLTTELEGERAGRTEDAAIMKAGVGDIELARFEHQRAMRGNDKPTPIGEWLEAMKADPSNAPPALREHLPSGSGAAGAEEDKGKEPDPKGTADHGGDAKAAGDGGEGGSSATTLQDKQAALAAIPHPKGSPEWRTSASKILGRS